MAKENVKEHWKPEQLPDHYWQGPSEWEEGDDYIGNGI